MTVKDTIEPKAYKLRGTVPVEHPLNGYCFDRSPNLAFKQILTLAEEAENTRTILARMLVGHPMQKTLSGLTPREALTIFLGISKIGVGWNHSPGDLVATDDTRTTLDIPYPAHISPASVLATKTERNEPSQPNQQSEVPTIAPSNDTANSPDLGDEDIDFLAAPPPIKTS